MLKKINNVYFFSLLVVYLVLFSNTDLQNYYILFLNLYFALSLFFLIKILLSKEDSFFSKKKLLKIVFFNSLLGVFLINMISYYYKSNFFVFSESDALFYHNEALKLNDYLFFSEGIQNFLINESLEDFGAVFIISLLYKIFESNLTLNFFYIIINCFTSKALFEIGNNFLSKKNSFIAAVTYSISSFTIWFCSSGLKETFLVFVVVSIYKLYYSINPKTRMLCLLYISLFLCCLLFFRPIIIFFCLVSFFVSLILSQNNKIKTGILILIFSFFIFYFSNLILNQANKFLVDGDVDRFIESKESTNMIKGGIGFSYLVNFISAFLGPFPTFNPNQKILLSFYSSGLFFRVLLSVPFLIGLYSILKFKLSKIYPVFIFVILEIVSLILILEALELRKSLLHFPFVFLISFLCFEKYEFELKKMLLFNRLFWGSLLLLLTLTLYWNYR